MYKYATIYIFVSNFNLKICCYYGPPAVPSRPPRDRGPHFGNDCSSPYSAFILKFITDNNFWLDWRSQFDSHRGCREMWFNSPPPVCGLLVRVPQIRAWGGRVRLIELQQLPLGGVTHVAQHGPCQPGCCCGSALTAVPVPGDFLYRVLLQSHFVQQRAPQAGMQLAVRVGGLRCRLR